MIEQEPIVFRTDETVVKRLALRTTSLMEGGGMMADEEARGRYQDMGVGRWAAIISPPRRVACKVGC